MGIKYGWCSITVFYAHVKLLSTIAIVIFVGFTVDFNAWKRASKNTVFLHGVKKTDRIFQIWETTTNSTTGEVSVYPLCKRKQTL